MPVFKADLKIGYASITQGLNQVYAAASNLRKLATPSQIPMPSTKVTSSIMADLKKLEGLRSTMKLPIPAMPSMPSAIGTATRGMQQITRPHRYMVSANLQKLQEAATKGNIAAIAKATIALEDSYKGFKKTNLWTKQLEPVLITYLGALKEHVKAKRVVTQSTKEEAKLQAVLLQAAKQRRSAFGVGVRGALPFGIGGIFQAFQQSREQKADLGQFFESQQAAGAPIGTLSKAFASIQAGAGPVLAIANAVKGLVFGFAKLARSVVGFGVSLVKLPLSAVMSIHRVIRSLTFSFLMFVHVFQRFFSKAFETVKTVQVATLVASGSLKDFATNMVQVIDLSTRYAIGMDALAKGLVKVSKAGFSSAEAQEILATSVRYATVFQAELNTVLDQTITVLRAFNLPAEEASNIIEKLYIAATQSNLSVGDLSTALGYAAGAAEAAGVSLDHTLAALMAFKDAGLRASRAGMAFRTGLAGLQRAIGTALGMTMNLDEAVKVLSIDWEKLEGDTLDLKDVFQEFHKVLGDGVSLQEKMAMRAIFGTRYYSYWITLIKTGDVTLQKHLDTLQRGIDLDKAAMEMSSSFIGIIIRLRNVWMSFKVSVLKEIAGPIESLEDSMENLRVVAEDFGSALGKIARIQVIQRLADAFKAITTTEGMEKVSEWLDRVTEKVSFWTNELIKAGGDWFEGVIGEDAAEGALGLLDIMGSIAVSSMEISKTMSQAFTGFAKEPGKIMKIVDDISNFLLYTVPSALRAIFYLLGKVLAAAGGAGSELGAKLKAQSDVLFGEGKKDLDAIIGGISGRAAEAITNLKIQMESVRNELETSKPGGFISGIFHYLRDNISGLFTMGPTSENGVIKFPGPKVRKTERLERTLEELEEVFRGVTETAKEMNSELEKRVDINAQEVAGANGG